jgi:hypothetical protein
MGAMKILTGLAMGAAVFAAPALAETSAGRDTVRIRLLDQCVISQSGKTAEEGAGPKCSCFAAKMSKAMTDEEIAAFKKGVPKRLAADAQTALATCK